MFASENEDAICEKMQDICAKNPGSTLVGRGLHSKALKVLWANADQDLWKSKINSLAWDVETNRNEFPVLMLQALQNTVISLDQLLCSFPMHSVIPNQTGSKVECEWHHCNHYCSLPIFWNIGSLPAMTTTKRSPSLSSQVITRNSWPHGSYMLTLFYRICGYFIVLALIFFRLLSSFKKPTHFSV